jgi:hypothetical protein
MRERLLRKIKRGRSRQESQRQVVSAWTRHWRYNTHLLCIYLYVYIYIYIWFFLYASRSNRFIWILPNLSSTSCLPLSILGSFLPTHSFPLLKSKVLWFPCFLFFSSFLLGFSCREINRGVLVNCKWRK